MGTIGFIEPGPDIPSYQPIVAMIFLIFWGVPSAIIGGVLGAALDVDDDFTIRGNYKFYQVLVPRLKKSTIFPSAPPHELQTFVERSRKQSS